MVTGAISSRGAKERMDFDHAHWLRQEKLRVFSSFLNSVDAALRSTTMMSNDTTSMRVARSEIRLVGSVPVRKAAAAVVAQVAVVASTSYSRGEDRAAARQSAEEALLGFVEAARTDLGATSDRDEELGHTDIVAPTPEVESAAREQLRTWGGGDGDEEE